MVVQRLKRLTLAMMSLAIFTACSGDEDPGANEGEACSVDADCKEGLLCRAQVCISTADPGDAGNNSDDGGNSNNDGGMVVEEEDFRISFKIAQLDRTKDLRLLNTATGEEQIVSPEGLNCSSGCWLSGDASTFLYLRTNTDVPGSFDLFSAPTTTLPVEFCAPETDCLVATAVRGVQVNGDLVSYVKQDGELNVAYFQRLNSTDPAIPIGSLGTTNSTNGDWELSGEAGKVVVYQPTLQTLDALVGDLGELQDSVDFTIDSQNYQEVSGSYFGGQVDTAFSDDGTRMAFVTGRAPLDGPACQNSSECAMPGARCGRFDRCAFLQVTAHIVDLENIDNLGGPCSSDEACGSVHTCDIPSEQQLDQATCIPRRVVLGLPAQQQQGDPPQTGCALTAGDQDFFFTRVTGPLSFGADGQVYMTAQRECEESNSPYSAILAINPESGAIRDVRANRTENFFAQDCYDADEEVALPETCKPYIQSAVVGPQGNKLALIATNPTISDPNLATRLVDIWTINRDGSDLTWVGRHNDINAASDITIHPLP